MTQAAVTRKTHDRKIKDYKKVDTSVRRFVFVTLIVSIWINASEVFRYFVIVMPGIREYLHTVVDVAPMNWTVFCIWGVWDMILTFCAMFMFWLMANLFGNQLKTAVAAGTVSWCFFFLLFWIAMLNMNLTHLRLALIALPLAWLELVVASVIASRLYAVPKE